MVYIFSALTAADGAERQCQAEMAAVKRPKRPWWRMIMEFKKLPLNSKKLLDEIVEAENPTQLLCERFENSSRKENEELSSLIRDLCQAEYISIMWADDKPYYVVVNNSAKTYDERLAEYEKEKKHKAKLQILI